MSNLLTPAEVADKLGLSVTPLHRWRQRGTGPTFIDLGGSFRYPADDLDRWVASRTHPDSSGGHHAQRHPTRHNLTHGRPAPRADY